MEFFPLMCLHISVTTKSFYLKCLIVSTNGGEYQCGKCRDTDLLPASWSVFVNVTFSILIIALFLANHISINKLLSLVFLTYKWMGLAKLDHWFANLVCKSLNVLKCEFSGPLPIEIPIQSGLRWGPGISIVGRYP